MKEFVCIIPAQMLVNIEAENEVEAREKLLTYMKGGALENPPEHQCTYDVVSEEGDIVQAQVNDIWEAQIVEK